MHREFLVRRRRGCSRTTSDFFEAVTGASSRVRLHHLKTAEALRVLDFERAESASFRAMHARGICLAKPVIRSIIPSVLNMEVRNASNRLNPVCRGHSNRYRVEGTCRSDVVRCQRDEEVRR
jgi:hypothetical protein